MTHAMLAHHIVPATRAPFVWSVIGGDAGESVDHIVARKEAERRAGRGEFWWGLGTPLGDGVEFGGDCEWRKIANLVLSPKAKGKKQRGQRKNSSLEQLAQHSQRRPTWHDPRLRSRYKQLHRAGPWKSKESSLRSGLPF